MSKVLGPTDDLKLYDNLRYELKLRKSSITSKQQDDHDRPLYKLQLAVQRERTKLLETLGKMENAYFTQHGKLPTNNDLPEHGVLIHKCRKINKLLKAWNTSN